MVLEDGPLRKRLREGRFLRQSSNPGNTEVPKIPRKVIVDLIYDEEKAHVDYKEISNKMAQFGPYEAANAFREQIWGIAQDEARHAEILKNMLQTLEREGKVV